jgi:hypothetical protein
MIAEMSLLIFGRGSRSRTRAFGFGDQRATVTLYPYIILALAIGFEPTSAIQLPYSCFVDRVDTRA